jgi:hypothetical protein
LKKIPTNAKSRRKKKKKKKKSLFHNVTRLTGSPISGRSLKFLSHPAIVGKRIKKEIDKHNEIMNVFILDEQNNDIGVSCDQVNNLAKFELDSKL